MSSSDGNVNRLPETNRPTSTAQLLGAAWICLLSIYDAFPPALASIPGVSQDFVRMDGDPSLGEVSLYIMQRVNRAVELFHLNGITISLSLCCLAEVPVQDETSCTIID